MKTNKGYRKKCQRFNLAGHAHELTFSCYKNRPLLNDLTACKFLAHAVEKASIKYKFELWAYVFMPDHVHLLIFPTEDNYSISKILQSIKLSVTKRLIVNLEPNFPLILSMKSERQDKKFMFWQDGGGYDRNIFRTDAIINSVNYIHNNPVRAKLVDDPSNWYYSSYSWYEERKGPLKINNASLVL